MNFFRFFLLSLFLWLINEKTFCFFDFIKNSLANRASRQSDDRNKAEVALKEKEKKEAEQKARQEQEDAEKKMKKKKEKEEKKQAEKKAKEEKEQAEKKVKEEKEQAEKKAKEEQAQKLNGSVKKKPAKSHKKGK